MSDVIGFGLWLGACVALLVFLRLMAKGEGE